jgi:hypothetical protein
VVKDTPLNTLEIRKAWVKLDRKRPQATCTEGNAPLPSIDVVYLESNSTDASMDETEHVLADSSRDSSSLRTENLSLQLLNLSANWNRSPAVREYLTT